MDESFPLVPISNLLACILVLISSFSANIFRSWNTGACMYALCVAIEAFATGVNTIIWSDNTNDVAPVWCDITSHLFVGAVCIPVCSLVITRRLCKITSGRTIPSDSNTRRTERIFDLSLCLGVPLIVIGIYYIVQGARYQIVEEEGCATAEIGSGLSLLLIDIWRIVLPSISVLFYCPRVLWMFYHHRQEINEFLASNATVDRGIFFRVMALGCLDILITLPLGALHVAVDSLTGSITEFWPGWTAVHESGWSQIPQLPASIWKQNRWDNFGIRLNMWIYPIYSLLFFLLFGLTAEARFRYCKVFWMVVKPIGLKPSTQPQVSDIIFESIHADQIASQFAHTVSLPHGENEAFERKSAAGSEGMA